MILLDKYKFLTAGFLSRYRNRSFTARGRANILFHFLLFLSISLVIFFIQLFIYERTVSFDFYCTFFISVSGLIISFVLLRTGHYNKAANTLIITMLSTLIAVTIFDWAEFLIDTKMITYMRIISLRYFYPMVIVTAMMFCSRRTIIVTYLIVIFFYISKYVFIKYIFNFSSDDLTFTTIYSFISFTTISFIALFSRRLADDAQRNIRRHMNNLEILVEERTSELKEALAEKDSANMALKEITEELLVLKNRADIQARTDILTGMNNKLAFIEKSASELKMFSRYDRNLSVLIADIDHFKVINDTFGHAAGDITLKDVANCITGNLRFNDFAARIGGEEFAVILPETDLEKAFSVGEKIREIIEKTVKAGGNVITCSIGVASIKDIDVSIDSILQRADVALYRAKNLGRNRVEKED